MTRRYDDQVEVRRRDDAPAEFLWHGRLFVVRDVLAQWVETGAWWCSPAARGAYVAAGDEPVGTSVSVGSAAVGSAAVGSASVGSAAVGSASVGTPDHPVGLAMISEVSGASATPAGLDPGERELWRVEASAGRAAGIGVFDLCFDWGTGTWTLVRTMD